MRRRLERRHAGAMLLTVALASPLPLAAQEPVPPEEYGRFERLGAATLSPDGHWIAYAVNRVDGEDELRVRALRGETSITVPYGAEPAFSAGSRWLAWSVGVGEAERERLEAAGEPVPSTVSILDLSTGERRSLGAAASFTFSADGRFLSLAGPAPDEPEGRGGDLRVSTLADGSTTTFGNVGEHAWSTTGSLLAMAISTGTDQGNGVQVYAAGAGRLRGLDDSGAAYRGLAWREEGADLAVLRTLEDAPDSGTAHGVLAWRGLDAPGAPTRFELHPGTPGMPDTLEVVEHARPRWSDGGRRLALGLRPMVGDDEADTARAAPAGEADSADTGPAAAPGTDETEEPDTQPADVQIWHTGDVRLVPEQASAAGRDGRRTLLAVWHLDEGRLVRLGDDLLEEARLLDGWRHAVERDRDPYPWGVMFGRPYHDVWLIDPGSGERERALEQVRWDWPSPAGRWLLWFDGSDYWSRDLDSGRTRNLTSGLPTVFADTAYDTPTDRLPPHGIGGWLEDDEAVLLHDRYDVWRVAPDGSASGRLTRGAEEEVVHRVVRLDRGEPSLPSDAPLYVELRGEWSGRTGYGRLHADGTVERLVFEDALVRGLQRADSAEVYAFTRSRFDDSTDWFVGGASLAGARRVSDTNPFLPERAWGRSELIDFTSETGRRLQGALFHPAGHDPARRYPMIVYTYEILSPRVHAFVAPSERDYYNVTAWTQQGYFVLMPDIVYRPREPGVSALEAVRPAVARVVEMGLVDPERVGLVGHSWGGYQATYLATRTDIFAASVAGAPLTDFVSMMGAIHWNPGIAELSHWETGQARMEVPFWEDPEAHRRNSPVHAVHEMETPLLMAFGDQDGVVDFDQGTGFYNFARRAGKQMVLLVYEGEDHGFRREENQRDYHRRILEWFGHYLKGEPAPRWITDGVPLTEQEEEARRVARKNPGR
ncbi:MAG: prolyl oligopeptidase family serine peptidase [Gemmatimonadetes bacterium]|nr:prolyl oligopeptidase family serine peptidase [Gemmatimonadota bacterium]